MERHHEETKMKDSMILIRSKQKNSIKKSNKLLPCKCKGVMFIQKKFTENIIPNRIKEKINDIYEYIDKSLRFVDNKISFDDGKFGIVNFDFHDKNTGEPLYCIIEKQNSDKRPWRMLNELCTKEIIGEKYGVSMNELPLSIWDSHNNDNLMLQNMDELNLVINIVKNTKSWHKLPIYGKVNNKQRRVLHLTKEEFVSKIRDTSEIRDILPVVSFDDKSLCIENIMIVKLTDNVDIGISFQMESIKKIKVTGIHLDKNKILLHHQLASPQHNCHCLDNFKSKYDDLKIGNVYDEQNQIKALKKENKKLRQHKKDKTDKQTPSKQQVSNVINTYF